ncbi:MAG: type IV pilus modification protein PilV [Pseudomonadota bacterium]
MPRIRTNQKFVDNLCGFSLIEVLVALFIQAFGLLGMTALQLHALKSTHAALTDSHVQFLLADMAERVRGNPTASYQIIFTDQSPAASKNCATQICSTDDLAWWDVKQWREKIEDAAYLPEGESQITFDSLTRTYEISIRYRWSQSGEVNLLGETRTVSLITSAGG